MKKLLLAATGCVLLCPAAQAHLVTTGLGPVYDGVGHFFLSPEDVLIAVALALFAGLRGPQAGRAVMIALPLGWLLGAGAGLYSGLALAEGQVASAVSLLLAGILIAADAALPGIRVSIVALILAAVHGLYNGMAMREVGSSVALLELAGIAVALFVLASLFAALVMALRRPTARIVVRVAGSWTAAIGLLLLGWTIRLKR
jgi:hydrogenase/urease accessory protein HupE